MMLTTGLVLCCRFPGAIVIKVTVPWMHAGGLDPRASQEAERAGVADLPVAV